MMNALDDMIARLKEMPREVLAEVQRQSFEATQAIVKWVPSPGPQTLAYYSQADELLYGGEPGGGKGLSIQTLIPTISGFKLMGELEVGDVVFDERGDPCSVTFVSEIHHRPCFKFTFDDGAEVIADDQHRWVTTTDRDRKGAIRLTDEWRKRRRDSRPRRIGGKKSTLFTETVSSINASREYDYKSASAGSVKTTLEILDTLKRPDGGVNHSIPVTGPLNLSQVSLPIDPYTLGLWLGDGASSSPSIGMMESDMLAILPIVPHSVVSQRLYGTPKYKTPFMLVRFGFSAQLRTLGILNNKRIPSVYLRASEEQRRELLRGLLDTDGHCTANGAIELGLSNPELMGDVCELVASLGIKSTIRVKKLSARNENWKDSHRIKFRASFPAFRLPRKLDRQKLDNFRGTTSRRYVVNVEPVQSVPTRCIQVDSPNHMYLCTRQMIPTHNTQLCLGLAFNQHRRSRIMRRNYGDLDRIVEDALKIHGSRQGFNGSPPPKLRISDTQQLRFGAANRVGDEQSFMGDGIDLLAIDEATHFAETQIRLMMGWVRTEVPGQRTRTVLATNPPLKPEGLWVNKMFAPWLDPRYPYPAKHGELRWVISDEDGNDLWVEGPNDLREINGKRMKPKSRTYIPSSVRDNPYYVGTEYETNLDAMPEPYRSLLMGGFRTTFKDVENQMIPTVWVQMAQSRWAPTPPQGVPMCAMGVDCSGGGTDPMVIAPRYDGWFPELIEIPGKDLPMDRLGSYSAGIVVSHRRHDAIVVPDLGGGYGSSLYERLTENGIPVKGYKGAEKTIKRTRDKKLGFTNVRTAAYWGFREALDPDQPGGSPIQLPDDPELVSDLTAGTFEITPNGVKMEPKEKIVERIGRSTNRGDAVVMSWWHGARETTHALDWRESDKRPNTAQMGRQPLSMRRRQR